VDGPEAFKIYHEARHFAEDNCVPKRAR